MNRHLLTVITTVVLNSIILNKVDNIPVSP